MGDDCHRTKQYVWERDGLLPGDGEMAATIGGLPLTFDLRFPHERRYALGYLYGLRNPQADIDHQLFERFVTPGDIVLDAGANVGVSAAEALACGAARVICVEPEQSLCRRLKVLASVSQGRLIIWNYALGAKEDTAELLLSVTHNQGHTISLEMKELFPHIFDGTLQKVRVTTVDRILEHMRSTIWKLDVEGAEVDVIRGAKATLGRSPPRVIFAELYDRFVHDVVDLLPGFQVWRVALRQNDYNLRLHE